MDFLFFPLFWHLKKWKKLGNLLQCASIGPALKSSLSAQLKSMFFNSNIWQKLLELGSVKNCDHSDYFDKN